MLSATINEVFMTDLLPLVGVMILSPLLLYLFPLESRLHTLTSWKLINAHRSKPVKDYLYNAKGLLKEGLVISNRFNILSDNGVKTVFSPKYAREISRIRSLRFSKIMASEFHSNIPGFKPFALFTTSANIFQDAVRMKLTQALGSVTKPLTEETSIALRDHWTDDQEWHEITLKPSILKIVAQLSSRVFLGDKICRNPNWLRITVDYTVDSMMAAEELRLWPKLVRPIVARFSTSCRKVQRELREAERIITPVLEERRLMKEAALKEGRPLPRYNDAMEWLEQVAKGRSYDPAAIQLTFSIAAIHTTSDMMTQAIYDLCGREELVQELRNEIVSVISAHGWKKTALYKLQLMDSFLKESQRLKPINIVSMRRQAEETIHLSDGTEIPKDTSLVVASDWMWDSTYYDNPETFDPHRFLKMRRTPGQETHAQLVSPSPEHLGFGLGTHACPGRFFAANEIKIFLCHMLLKYDFKLVEGTVPQHRRYGFALHADSQAKNCIRRRHEEIVLEDISD